MDRVRYYLELLASMCGFDKPDAITTSGLVIVVFATVILIFAFYRAVLITIWPGETSTDHIKRLVLIEEDVVDEN